jgi:hypothetical protein
MNRLSETSSRRLALILFGLAALQFALVGIHLSPLSYWFDPIARVAEWTQVELTSAPVAKAQIHLDRVDADVARFETISGGNPSDGRLAPIAKRLVYEDNQAMFHMDQAKRAGQNIQPLVDRLCDSLELQYALLDDAHQSASANTVNDLWKSLRGVKDGLDKAMEW